MEVLTAVMMAKNCMFIVLPDFWESFEIVCFSTSNTILFSVLCCALESTGGFNLVLQMEQLEDR